MNSETMVMMMRKFILSILYTSIAVECFSQPEIEKEFIHTTDGKRLNKKRVYLDNCIQSFSGTLENKSARKFCECEADLLDYRFTNSQLEQYTRRYKELGFQKLVERDQALMDQIKNCMDKEGNANFFADPVYTQKFRDQCIEDLKKNHKYKVNENDLDQFCACTAQIMQQRGVPLKRMEDLQDQNSILFNEIAFKCGYPFIDSSSIAPKWYNNSSLDIEGMQSIDSVTIITIFGMQKIRIKIGNYSRFWLIDSGASDLLISEDFGDELLKDGILSDNNFIGTGQYVVADNRRISCKRYRVNGISLGKFSINNVVIAVSKEAGLFLLGKSLLNKFRKWSLDNEHSLLILEK